MCTTRLYGRRGRGPHCPAALRVRPWNLAPLIPPTNATAARTTTCSDLIDHVLVSHALLDQVGEVTTADTTTPSVSDNPAPRRDEPGSDHRPVITHMASCGATRSARARSGGAYTTPRDDLDPRSDPRTATLQPDVLSLLIVLRMRPGSAGHKPSSVLHGSEGFASPCPVACAPSFRAEPAATQLCTPRSQFIAWRIPDTATSPVPSTASLIDHFSRLCFAHAMWLITTTACSQDALAAEDSCCRGESTCQPRPARSLTTYSAIRKRPQ